MYREPRSHQHHPKQPNNNSALVADDVSKAPVQKNFIRPKKKSHAYQEYVHLMETCHLQSNNEITRLLTGIVNNQTSAEKMMNNNFASNNSKPKEQPQQVIDENVEMGNSYKSVEELDEFTNLLEEYLTSLSTPIPADQPQEKGNNKQSKQAATSTCKLDLHSLPDSSQIDSLKSLATGNDGANLPVASVESFKQLADLPPAEAYRLRKLHYYKKLFERYKDQRGLQLAFTIHECLQLMQSQLGLGSDEEPLKLASLKPSVENKALISSQQKNNDKFYQDMKLWQSVTAITDLMQCECDALLQQEDEVQSAVKQQQQL